MNVAKKSDELDIKHNVSFTIGHWEGRHETGFEARQNVMIRVRAPKKFGSGN